MKSNINGFTKFFFCFLAAFLLFEFFLTQTVWGLNKVVYGILILLFLSVVFIVLYYQPDSISIYTILWIPFLLIAIVGNLHSQNYENLIFYLTCLVLLIIAKKINWRDVFPINVFKISGILMVIGIGVQILLPTLYNSNIASMFNTYKDILYWADGYGYAGFTFQLGMTAILLIYFECAILYGSNIKNKAVTFLLCLVCIFLTGKRTIMLLALLLPFAVYVFDKKPSQKKVFNIMTIVVITLFASIVFVVNVSIFADSTIFGRLAEMIMNIQSGAEITSGRSAIYKEAYQLFSENKLLGIGFGQFKEVSSFNTDVHNAYLQILCECGILGFFLFIIPVVVSLMRCIRLNREFNDNPLFKISLFIQMFFILYGLTGNSISDNYCYVFYFIAVAISIKGQNTEIIQNEENTNSYIS